MRRASHICFRVQPGEVSSHNSDATLRHQPSEHSFASVGKFPSCAQWHHLKHQLWPCMPWVDMIVEAQSISGYTATHDRHCWQAAGPEAEAPEQGPRPCGTSVPIEQCTAERAERAHPEKGSSHRIASNLSSPHMMGLGLPVLRAAS